MATYGIPAWVSLSRGPSLSPRGAPDRGSWGETWTPSWHLGRPADPRCARSRIIIVVVRAAHRMGTPSSPDILARILGGLHGYCVPVPEEGWRQGGHCSRPRAQGNGGPGLKPPGPSRPGCRPSCCSRPPGLRPKHVPCASDSHRTLKPRRF